MTPQLVEKQKIQTYSPLALHKMERKGWLSTQFHKKKCENDPILRMLTAQCNRLDKFQRGEK
jgi:hypothetical protein